MEDKIDKLTQFIQRKANRNDSGYEILKQDVKMMILEELKIHSYTTEKKYLKAAELKLGAKITLTK